MAYLAQGCIAHGQAGTTEDCCSGLKKWTYDAKTGIPYVGFMCWTAQCAGAGQFAGPNGQGNHCCPPLTNVAGRCGQSTPAPLPYPMPPVPIPSPSIIPGIPDMYLYIGGGLLLVLMMMGGKKGK